MTWIIIITIVCILIFWKIKSRNSMASDIVPKEIPKFPEIFDKLEGYDLLIKRIVFLALFYRSKLNCDIQKSTDASSELIYFLLHIIDRQLFSLYGADKRDEIYDKLSNELIVEFSGALLKGNAPMDAKRQLATSMRVKMLDDLNYRQEIYSKCESVFGEKFPSAGTMIFALAFYIHKALGKTNIDNVDTILTGERRIEKEELTNFPSVEDVLALCMYMADVVIEKLEINKCLQIKEDGIDWGKLWGAD